MLELVAVCARSVKTPKTLKLNHRGTEDTEKNSSIF